MTFPTQGDGGLPRLHREDFVQLTDTGEYAVVERAGSDAEIENEEFFTNHYFDDGTEGTAIARAQAAPWEDKVRSGNAEVPEPHIEVTRWQRVRPGYALVFCIENEKRYVRKAEDLRLIQRHFCIGGHVMKRGGKQYGTVLGVDKMFAVVPCSIEKGDQGGLLNRTQNTSLFEQLPQAAKIISASELWLYPSNFLQRYFVYRNQWLVKGVSDSLHLRIAMNDPWNTSVSPSVCIVDAVVQNVVPLGWGSRSPYTVGVYYAGQRVRADVEVWESAWWVEGSYPQGVVEGKLMAVIINEIEGQWIASRNDNCKVPDLSGMSAEDMVPLQSKQLQARTGAGDIGLVRPDIFANNIIADAGNSANPQSYTPGGRNFSEDDEMKTGAFEDGDDDADNEGKAPLTGPISRLSAAFRRYRRVSTLYSSRDSGIPNGIPVRIAAVRSTVRVQWQDSSISQVSSTELEEIVYIQDHDLFPGFQVALDVEGESRSGGVKVGIVLSVNNQERTGRVKWEKQEGGMEGDAIEVIPLYELARDSSACHVSDVVIRTDRENLTDNWVGEVLEVGERVKVQWANSQIEEVDRDELISVVNLGGDFSGSDTDDETGDDESDLSEDMSSSDEEEPSLLHAFRRFRRVVQHSSAVTQNGFHEERDSAEGDVAFRQGSEENPPDGLANPHDANKQEPGETHHLTPSRADAARDSNQERHASSSVEATAVPAEDANEENKCPEPSFRLVDGLERHHFEEDDDDAINSQPGFSRTVAKEWRRLATDLPSHIYVHGCEDRLNLLRAAIIGPAGTPYRDVLFFFDIYLPPDYPASPPKVYFWSHGRGLNPNLYPDGHVCLSILGTWKGRSIEEWSPENSNVTRVLLSLQAMVFVEKPFFNEPDHERFSGTPDGEWKSNMYSETTTLLCLRHVITTLEPYGTPEDFISFTRRHYALRGSAILERCRNIASGKNDLSTPSQETSQSPADSKSAESSTMTFPTTGFRLSVRRLIPRLEETFAQAPGGCAKRREIEMPSRI